MASAGKLIVLMQDRGLQNPLYTTTATLSLSLPLHQVIGYSTGKIDIIIVLLFKRSHQFD